MVKKVFVSGCFDLIHSGHIAFLKEASKYGEVYVSIGSDNTINGLKNRLPIYNEEERLFMISELKSVKKVFIASGSGSLDFKKELEQIKPDIFVVNKDGDKREKKQLCESLGIEYLVLERTPFENLPERCSTDLRKNFNIPYRIDIAGGWMDQPFLSKHYAGGVITASIKPTQEFNSRSGMATSTRNKAIRLWGGNLPKGNTEELAKILFAYDNPPGTIEVAGSQDAIGIIFPNVNFLNYNGKYWPDKITSISDDKTINWLEYCLSLVSLEPRKGDYKVLEKTKINLEDVISLSQASSNCWNAITERDTEKFGKYVKQSFEAQTRMFPAMVNEDILSQIEKYKGLAYGWKLSGAGGGGYIILVSDKPIENSIKIKIRRENSGL